jgi:hypothetical protein
MKCKFSASDSQNNPRAVAIMAIDVDLSFLGWLTFRNIVNFCKVRSQT